jgi:hypothetical protein
MTTETVLSLDAPVEVREVPTAEMAADTVALRLLPAVVISAGEACISPERLVNRAYSIALAFLAESRRRAEVEAARKAKADDT